MTRAAYTHLGQARWRNIREDLQYEPTEYDLENKRVWGLYPLDTAKYFSLLDKFTCEDEFFVRLGRAALDKVFGSGIEHLGDLIALDLQTVIERTGLTPREAHRLAKLVEGFGLSFESDTAQWAAYRGKVAAAFRLQTPYDVRLPQSTRSPWEI